MPSATHQPTRLVAKALANPDDGAAVSTLVTQCQRMALRHVRRKTTPAQLAVFGLSAEDLALDSIAELFEQSPGGRFTRLRQHFDAAGEALSGEEVERTLRRIVGGAVNDRLFQICREHDPGLARLIRNLKRAARKAKTCKLARAEGRLWITATERSADARPPDRTGGSTPGALPLLPTPQLEDALRRRLRGSVNAARAVQVLAALLCAHKRYRNGYPVASFAVVLRAATVRLHMPFLEEPSAAAAGRLSEDMHTLVGWRLLQAITETRAACYAGYVEAGKVSAAHYEAYFRAIRDVLIAEFIDLKDEVPPLWTFLGEHLAGEALTSAAYRRAHRNTFEYLLDLSRRELVACLREDVGDGAGNDAPGNTEASR